MSLPAGPIRTACSAFWSHRLFERADARMRPTRTGGGRRCVVGCFAMRSELLLDDAEA